MNEIIGMYALYTRNLFIKQFDQQESKWSLMKKCLFNIIANRQEMVLAITLPSH